MGTLLPATESCMAQQMINNLSSSSRVSLGFLQDDARRFSLCVGIEKIGALFGLFAHLGQWS
eukprot:525562-Karenia_brevis.AAC.1